MGLVVEDNPLTFIFAQIQVNLKLLNSSELPILLIQQYGHKFYKVELESPGDKVFTMTKKEFDNLVLEIESHE